MAHMRVVRRAGWSVVALVSIGAGALAMSSVSASATDVDVYGFKGSLTPAATLFPTGPTTTYSDGGACVTEEWVSTYIDLSGSESGGCAVNGSGSLALKACSTGAISATSWQLTEPSSDVATFTGSGVVVGGVAVIAGSPLHASGDGYSDPAKSLSPGSGVVVGLLAPFVGQTCVAGVSMFNFAGTFVGEY